MFSYVESESKKKLYTNASEYFSSNTCGTLSRCTLYATGCIKTYDSGKLIITSKGLIKAVQNIT